jgi:tripartite-type tricarboxylate transporter receptor subunit TctC
MKRFVAAAFAAIAVTAAGLSGAAAQEWPKAGPITIIVPFAPGAGNDLLGRLTAEYFTKRLGQQVVVENVAGGGSAIGLDRAARAKPDGYTLLWSPSDGMSVLPAVRKTVPYKVPDDFEFLARIVHVPFVVAVHPSVPATNVAELIALSKERPGRVRYGSSGVGGAPHMGTVLFGMRTGVRQTHIPFNGIGPALTDLIGGHTEMLWLTPTTGAPHVQAGKIRAIAQTGPTRHSLYPDTPTLKEAGVNVELTVYYGMMTPKNTPAPILDRLRNEIRGMLEDPAIVKRLNELGYTPAYLNGDDFKKLVIDELNQWKQVATEANISLAD